MRIVFVIFVISIALTHQAKAGYVVSDTLKFAFLTDLHVSPGNENDSGLHLLIEEINSLPLDFVVITGDLTNTGSNDELFAVERALKKLNHTFYIIPGNHETNWSESAGLLFNRIWGNDRFSFSLKGFNFIGFNTGPYMKMGDGHVKNEDVLWMQEKIKNYSETGKPLIAFAHYPLEDGLDNWDRVSEILKTGNCKLVFCGHGHKQQLLNFNGIPGIMGRALFMKKENSPGYQLVELKNDSIFVFTKVYRKEQVKTPIQFNYLHPDTLQQISSSKLPDYEINNEYPDTRPIFNWHGPASIFTGPAIYKGRSLIFGNSLGELTSLDIKTKRVNWVTKFEGPLFSNPVVIGHTVVLGTSGGMVCGISARSGEILWKHDFKRPVLAEAAEDGHFAYLACGDSAFVKIDAGDGTLVWQFTQLTGLVQGKPAIHKNRLVFGAWDTWLYCLDKETGKLIWKWNNGKPQKLFSPGNIVPAISHGKVFLVAPDRYMTALDLETGREIWRTNRYKVRESMGISPDGKAVYAKLMNDTVIAVSGIADKFELLSAVNAGFGYEHSPCPLVSDGQSLVVTSKSGLVAVIDQKGQRLRWRHKVNNSSANKIIMGQSGIIWISFVNGQISAFKTVY